MPECTFCRPEDLSPRVLNDSSKLFISFLSDPRMSKGHSLVVPRRHVVPGEDLLTTDEILAIEHETQRLERILLSLGYMGVDSFQKTRPLIPEGTNGTKMDHYHRHIIPSSPGLNLYDDGIAWGHRDSWRKLPDGEREAMREALAL